MTIADAQINAKYESSTNRLVLEHDRVKLPRLVESIKSNPNYLMIDSNWSSSWNEVTKSRLIESLIINIPIMPIVIYEKEYNSHQVIDGKERLRAIVNFYGERSTLTGLEVETSLEGYTYSALPAEVKDRLNNCSLNLVSCIPVHSNQSELEIKKLIDTIKKRYANG